MLLGSEMFNDESVELNAGPGHIGEGGGMDDSFNYIVDGSEKMGFNHLKMHWGTNANFWLANSRQPTGSNVWTKPAPVEKHEIWINLSHQKTRLGPVRCVR